MRETATASGAVPLARRIANAPCSWGVLEFGLPGETLGYQQVLDEMRDTGYAGTELGDWGFMPTDPAHLRRELDDRNLALLGAFVPVAFASAAAQDEGELRAVRTARLLADTAGTEPLIVLADDNARHPVRTRQAGRITKEQGLSDPQWDTFCAGVNRVAAAVRREAGLHSVFHHHCAGFVEGPWEIDRLLDGTDPALVGLCFDTGHYVFGGGADALDGLRQHRNRIRHVHVKDCRPALLDASRHQGWDYFESMKHGIFCELGQGSIDFAAVLHELQRTGYPGWVVVEQDVLPGTGAPKEYARRNREFLRRCGF